MNFHLKWSSFDKYHDSSLLGWFVFQNLIGGAVSQNVPYATALVAGLGSRVRAVLHDVTHLERQQSKLSKYNYPGVDEAFLTKKI